MYLHLLHLIFLLFGDITKHMSKCFYYDPNTLMKHLGRVIYPIPGCGTDVVKSESSNEASVGTHRGFDFYFPSCYIFLSL